ncbi:MAG: arginyl-tRNA synthetase [Paenibacillaceae bacterium]|nr:arginyl-tRNA synthetase [Paenibacillaceae bacterium]
MNIKQQLAEHLAGQLDGIDSDTLAGLLEYPPNPEMGDVSLPCFKLSKQLRQAPNKIAEQLAERMPSHPLVLKAQAVNGYLNVFLEFTAFTRELVQEILTTADRYGSSTVGEGKTIVVDYSSPNIAKPFHIGHLRSTVIGNALLRIFSYMGYKCVGVNHLGDWGTQFGKLISAYLRWGSEEAVRQDGIEELLRLYVKFHDEAEREPALEDEARAWFAKLEQGNEQASQIWREFIDISLKEFDRVYDLLGVQFDSIRGESFYNDKTASVIEQLREKQLLEEDEGAHIVRLDAYDMPPAIMLKKDGSSLYHTRDAAAAIYRKNTYDFDKCIYVTDYAQNLHFQQWFKVIELMGYEWGSNLVHVPFGRVSLEGVRMATRKGNVIKLDDLLRQAIEKTLEIIEAKNPQMEGKEEVARQVGVGAVIFSDLSSNRIKDIVFTWEEALNFDGETGPYVQYTHARACSVLRKAGGGERLAIGGANAADAAGTATVAAELLNDDVSQLVMKQLAMFPEKVTQAMEKYEPSIVSRYLIDLAQSFNRFYHDCPILVDDAKLRSARLALVESVRITMSNGLRLIGLETPERI